MVVDNKQLLGLNEVFHAYVSGAALLLFQLTVSQTYLERMGAAALAQFRNALGNEAHVVQHGLQEAAALLHLTVSMFLGRESDLNNNVFYWSKVPLTHTLTDIIFSYDLCVKLGAIPEEVTSKCKFAHAVVRNAQKLINITAAL